MSKELAAIKLAACRLATAEEKSPDLFPEPPEDFDSWAHVMCDLVTEIYRLRDSLQLARNSAKAAIEDGEAYNDVIIKIVDDALCKNRIIKKKGGL